MLRRQQPTAVVGARQRIVEGAVGMDRMACRNSSNRAWWNWTKNAMPRW
jgi:hypothetical protein